MRKQRKNNHRDGRAVFFRYASERITEKRTSGLHGTADLYRATRNRVHQFMRERPLYFQDITSGLVDRFVSFLRSLRLRVNTVNTYVSNFRAIYNRACRDGLLPVRAVSPFAHLTLKRELPSPRAIDEETLREIIAMGTSNPALIPAIDYGVFSYLACGMPFVDLAHLTWDNIRGNEIIYRRMKTGARIRVGITLGMRRIIERYSSSGSPYIFPVLSKGRESDYESYKSTLRTYNASLKSLGRKLSHPVCLTSYVFRHTWATEALRKHIPVSVISQALGHTSEKTTRFYLAALDQSELDQANALITENVDRLVAKAG